MAKAAMHSECFFKMCNKLTCCITVDKKLTVGIMYSSLVIQ